MAGQAHQRVVVVDGADTMVHAWDVMEASGAQVVAVRHATDDGAHVWTVWRSEDLFTLPRSLHESGLRQVGALLSLAQRPGIQTWPEGDPPPPDRAVLVVADGVPVALVLSASDPDGAAVFETHVELPPDLPTASAPPVSPDGSAGDDREPPAEDWEVPDDWRGVTADDAADEPDPTGAEPAESVTADDADDTTGAQDVADDADDTTGAQDVADDAADGADDGAGDGGWWTRAPADPTGPVRGGGDWATATPVHPPPTPTPPPSPVTPPAAMPQRPQAEATVGPAAGSPPATSNPSRPSVLPPPASPPGTGTPPATTPPDTEPGQPTGPLPPPPPGSLPESPGADDAMTPSTTRLHPHLDAPDRVDSGASITVTIGVGAEAQPGLTTSGDGMEVQVDDAGEVVFEVMVLAQGFTVHGARSELRVAATAPDKKRLTITLDADEVTAVTRTIIEVQYGQAGTPIGRAWREIVIAPAGATVTGEVQSGALPVMAGGQEAADLTVMAVGGQDDRTMLWTFFSPHDVALPDQAVAWNLEAASAKDLALQQVLKMAKATKSPLSDNEMRGLATAVADAMPPAFWQVLGEVAGAPTVASDRTPSLLLVTDEPWVPWELAATSEDYLAPELVDPDVPAFLGAQFAMGRWLVPRQRGRVESPALPPPTTHEVAGMALVIGDYAASINWRKLPEAQAEGEELATRYPASRWTATASDMDRLLDNDLDGQPGDILHMACHGATDPDNLQWSGIILSDDEDRLSPLMIRGSVFPRERRPLVFLNACQVGQGVDGLSDSGSLGAAFIREGATGFVAPLWEVDDALASSLALDFYRDTLERDCTVGEALRRARSTWTPTTATRLAYVYWGHPDLRLHLDPTARRTPPGSSDAPDEPGNPGEADATPLDPTPDDPAPVDPAADGTTTDPADTNTPQEEPHG